MSNALVPVARVSRRARLGLAGRKLGAALAMSFVLAGPAFAQAAGALPADETAAKGFMEEKGGAAIAIAFALSMVSLGIVAAKLPRKAS
ncbi:hypothetical protein [Xanthomonas euvesicatoria]|uniref:hypothetical protein n=1 Tax=Xanthomonas euvesicatoria TaxID=456327 RepID=UPI00062D98B4|nr:hypothetical protein [Xanthomonas euvesicatoria]APO90442.1 hypothetical protein BJD11_10625 [Xanthomonas euvesicatoria]KLB35674.1 hypothetical protein XEUV206_23400 [Xanthomonas euvesicatoria]MCC8584037.1 hypothetical protein [Xanthomonas euvesicatoria pv. euvesicatoria]MCC8593922.1 hypothetical protein [Xanthomonas euvesicatoria pv. euvesicatoria]